jgi:hypothetical protein
MSTKSALIAVFFLITSAAFAQNAANAAVDPDVIAREKQYWLATKAHDAASINKLVADDFTIVTMGGPVDKKELLESLPQLSMSTPALWSWKYVQLGPNSYAITYQLAASMKYGSENVPGHFYATSVWTQQNGQWQLRLLQQTPFDE